MTEEQITDHMKRGHTEQSRDSRTGEIVLWWTYYSDVTEEWVLFSKRFHPHNYVSDRQLKTDYHFTTEQRNQLGGYQYMASRLDRWGYQVSTYWWQREKVEAVMNSKPGYQAELF
jgi:hypothetical protein